MHPEDKSVFRRLAIERERLKLLQDQVAKHCNVSKKTVGRWEKNTAIPADKLALLNQLGFDVQFIITGDRTASVSKDENDRNEKKIIRDISATYGETDAKTEKRTPRPFLADEIGPDEQQWLEWIRAIKPGDRQIVEAILKRFALNAEKQNSQDEAAI